MKILPLAFDSFGVRSMSTFLQIGKLYVHIDPGVALAPKRYGLGPTKEELEALDFCKKKIIEFAKKYAKVILVSHYHFDHIPYPEDNAMYENCFKDKIVLAKDITKDINLSGKERGKFFENKVSPLAKSLEWADGKEFEIDDVHIAVSPAVWHGEVKSKVGKVIMFYLERGKDSFLFGSDAQGLLDPEALKWVQKMDPKFMIIDGFPTVFIGWKLAQQSFERSKEVIKEAIKTTQAKTVILEHHLVRDSSYKERMKDVFELAENLNKKLITAAEFYGIENFFLETWRKEISQGKRKVDIKSYFTKLHKRMEL